MDSEVRRMTKERLKFCLEMMRKYPEQTAYIHPSVVIPEWVSIGENVVVHEGVTLGSQGFGFERDSNGVWLHIPHIGRLVIEDNVEIFEGTNICRGTIEDTVIGKGTKIYALCHIGHNAIIGKNCLLTAHCIIGGSSVLGDNVYVGLNTTIKNKIKVVDGVFIGQSSNVVKDIIIENSVWAGNPAKFLRWRKETE